MADFLLDVGHALLAPALLSLNFLGMSHVPNKLHVHVLIRNFASTLTRFFVCLFFNAIECQEQT